MDVDRFDVFTRARSRPALLRAAASGAGAAVAGARDRATSAQNATPDAGTAGTACPGTTAESEEIARTYFEAFNTGNADALGIARGRIAELWTEADTLGRLRQTGGAPGPGTPSTTT